MNKQSKQIEMEYKYNKKNIPDIIKKCIADTEGAGNLLNECAAFIKDYIRESYSYSSKNRRVYEIRKRLINKPNYLHELALEVLSATLPLEEAMPIQQPVTHIANFLPMEKELERIKAASEILVYVSQSNLYEIIAARESESGSLMVKSNVVLDGDTKQAIMNTKYLPPMIVPPCEITSNYCSGYLTFDASVIKGKKNHHNKKQCLDVLNLLNQQKLSLDVRMMEFIEQPTSECDTPEKVQNFRLLQNTSTQVYLEILEAGNEFYITHDFDKRGRVYSNGYHVNIQSTDYKKSLINLSNKQIIPKD